MDYLIQNNSQAPIFVPMVEIKDGKMSTRTRFMFEPSQITKVDVATYKKMAASKFYRDKIERGILAVLNAGSNAAVSGAARNLLPDQINYARYVGLVDKISAAGGLSDDSLKAYLDREGMPTVELVRKNLGSHLTTEEIESYRERYLIEKSSGLHDQTLVLPTGSKVRAAANVTTVPDKAPEKEDADESDLSKMTLEALKIKADELGVDYDENITFARLVKRVEKALQNDEDEEDDKEPEKKPTRTSKAPKKEQGE